LHQGVGRAACPIEFDGVKSEIREFQTGHVLGGLYKSSEAAGLANGVAANLTYALKRQRDGSKFRAAYPVWVMPRRRRADMASPQGSCLLGAWLFSKSGALRAPVSSQMLNALSSISMQTKPSLSSSFQHYGSWRPTYTKGGGRRFPL
jgi:hypothetical protein